MKSFVFWISWAISFIHEGHFAAVLAKKKLIILEVFWEKSNGDILLKIMDFH